MTVVLLLVTFITALVTLLVPWIGAAAYYVLGIMQPQNVWPWIFENIRIALIITLVCVVSFVFALFMGKVNIKRLLHHQNILMAVVWLMVNASYHFSDFRFSAPVLYDLKAAFVLEYLNKAMAFYFIGVLLIDNIEKLIGLIYAICAVVVFYVYWSNHVYLSGMMWHYSEYGRMGGPGGLYEDENIFAMVFVVGLPMLYYIGLSAKRWYVRYAIWAIIPLLWHAIFLTGSRGAMLALGITTVYIAWKSYNRKLSIGLTAGLALALIYQGGILVSRVEWTKGMAEEPTVEALDPRLISWKVGAEMIKDHPFLGVGAGAFTRAFPFYSDTKVYVAHNTFIQFAADSGIIAGLIYLYLFWLPWRRPWTLSDTVKNSPYSLAPYLGDIIRASSIGFFVCSMFLNLMLFEVLYALLLMSLTWQFVNFQPKNTTADGPNAFSTRMDAGIGRRRHVKGYMPGGVRHQTPGD
ncbi:MAG: O-antigen ligase family protein [Granulosicoccus sp.]